MYVAINDVRRQRVADLMADYQYFQECVTEVNFEPADSQDVDALGYVELRQCAEDARNLRSLEGTNFLSIPCSNPFDEERIQLQQIHINIFIRRMETFKIHMRQCFVKRWIERRQDMLTMGRYGRIAQANLRSLDRQLQEQLAMVSDIFVYEHLRSIDLHKRRWLDEDPSLEYVMNRRFYMTHCR